MCYQLERIQIEKVYTNTVFEGVSTEVINTWSYSVRKRSQKKKGKK
jgi:hypothetical protein